MTAASILTVSTLSRPKGQGGFTLLELLITVLIMGILASLSLPSFRDFVAGQRVKNASFDLVAALAFTRSEALKRNGNVVLTKAAGGWKNGWTITAGGSALRSQSAFNNLSITDSASVSSLTFSKDGRLTSAGTNFTIDASPSLSGVTPRCVGISLSGMPSSKLGAC